MIMLPVDDAAGHATCCVRWEKAPGRPRQNYDLNTTDTLAYTSGMYNAPDPDHKSQNAGYERRGIPCLSPSLRCATSPKALAPTLVLRDVDFTVNHGDVTCMIGASGSGKSTLLRCINLLETPTHGSVLFHGRGHHGQRL